ncbi:unnamed protein product [Symbiodinium sp. CCMP2592]|nr:unnamed protein product [Symbiodinium sp. CCMP2592]
MPQVPVKRLQTGRIFLFAAALVTLSRHLLVTFAGTCPRPRQLNVMVAADQRAGSVGGSGSPDAEPEQAMVLEEEFKRGETLEHEFQRVLEARAKGSDIKREPGLEAKSDFEIAVRGGVRWAGELISGIDFSNGVTWVCLPRLVPRIASIGKHAHESP